MVMEEYLPDSNITSTMTTKDRIEVPDFITSLSTNYNSQKVFSTSRQILYHCEQIEDVPTLEATIQYLLSNSIEIQHSEQKYNVSGEKVNERRISKCLTSLLTPRDQTNLVRLLGSRGMFYTMLSLVKNISVNINLVDSKKRNAGINNMQYLYAAAMTALAKSPNPKYRMRCSLLLDEMDELNIVPNSYVITALFLSIDGGEAARAF